MIHAFFAALAIPLTTAVLLMVALWVSGPRAPLVALLVNAFVLFEVAGCSRAVRLPMPAGYFRRSRFERRWIYELLGIRVFKRLMRSRAYRGINPDFRLSRGRSGFADLAQTMEAAEAAHALVFAIVSTLGLPPCCCAGSTRRPGSCYSTCRSTRIPSCCSATTAFVSIRS
jgi:hypothetical protein